MSQIPQRQIGISIKLAQNTQTSQSNTFAGLGSSGGGLGGLLSGGLGGLLTGSGGNTINIQGLRVSAHIKNAGTMGAEADVRIWGLPPNVLNQLNTLGVQLNLVPQNVLTITAGDSASGMFNIYQNVIQYSYADYENQPDVPLVIKGNTGGYAVYGSKATSFPQGFSVQTAINQVAQKLGLTVNNVGNVQTQLPPMYVSGSPLVQMQKIARAAGITLGLSPSGVVELLQKGQPRQGGSAVTISAATGMIASPAFDSLGIVVKSLFNPQVTFHGNINVQSSVLSAVSGAQPGAQIPQTWMVYKIDLDLEALVPKGQWMMTLWAQRPGQSPNLPPSS